jgi:hypothetical protein
MDFSRRLKKLKKDYQENVKPALRRHSYARTKSEARREKHGRALKRQRRSEIRVKYWRPKKNY